MQRGEGEKWLGPVPIPEDLHRQFASRCIEAGFLQAEVLRALVGVYVEGYLQNGTEGAVLRRHIEEHRKGTRLPSLPGFPGGPRAKGKGKRREKR